MGEATAGVCGEPRPVHAAREHHVGSRDQLFLNRAGERDEADGQGEQAEFGPRATAGDGDARHEACSADKRLVGNRPDPWMTGERQSAGEPARDASGRSGLDSARCLGRIHRNDHRGDRFRRSGPFRTGETGQRSRDGSLGWLA